MSLIKRAKLRLKNKGFVYLIKGIWEYLHRRIMIARGIMSMSLNGTTTRFVASDEYVVIRTGDRFEEEKSELSDILEEVDSGDIFWDIGANTGLYSCFVANHQKKCQVFAFEPYPENVLELKRNAEINDCNRISVFDIALSNTSGTTGLSVPDEPTPGYGTGSISNKDDNISIQTIQGDTLIENKQVPSPNIVKIDVEGAEALVVRGLTDSLSKGSCRLVFCELHPSDLSEQGFSISEMVTKFERMGFTVQLHNRWEDAYLLEARRD